MKISVIMPVYNSQNYVRQAVDSILSQTCSDFELIIIDDASTDSTVEIIKSYTDSRIIFLEKKQNSGYIKSLNLGLQLAKGEYIARMDADDVSHKQRFEKQVTLLDTHPDVMLCGSWVKVFGGRNEKIKYPVTADEIRFTMLRHNPIAHPTAMWRRSISVSYNEDYYGAEDFELFSRLSQPGKVVNIPEILLFYRDHQQQVSISHQTQQQGNSRKVKLNQLNFLHLKPTSSQEIAHLCLFDGGFRKYNKTEDVKQADEWMFKIYEANKKYNIYNEQLLLQFWKSVFFGTGLYVYNLKVWRVLKNSHCIKICQVSFAQRTKQFIKCLINWRVNLSI